MGDQPGQDRTAIVTGAGGGLGRQIAQSLLRAGFRVALLGRNAHTLEDTVALSSIAEGQALVLPADVSEPRSLGNAFEQLYAHWRRLDILVNNAGIFGASADLENVTLTEWNDVLTTNLTGAFLCAQHAIGIMKRQDPVGGRVINIGSVSAHRPRPRSVAYAVSKHALTGLSRSIALEGREHLISCTQVDVGNAATAMTAPIATGRTQTGTVTPEPTFDPRHVGELVAQLAVLPADVSVPELTVLATQMPFLGRG